MWCQKRMLKIPATEKMRENPRKYHFFPSQSMLVVRNSSTGLSPFLLADGWLAAVSA
jgi:hypothetical protein